MRNLRWGLATGLLVSALTIPAAAQDAIVPDDFPSIRAAVARATDVDASGTIDIFVRAGTYVENVTIRRANVILSGEDAATTTIQGTGQVDTVQIRAGGTLVEGFTILASGLLDSIDARNASGSVIQGNILTGGAGGFRLRGSDGLQVLDNEIFGTTDEGIKAEATRNLLVMGNFVHDNTGEGIDLQRVRLSRVQSNDVMNNGSNGLRDRDGARNSFIENQSMGNGDNGFDLENTTNTLLDSNTSSGNASNGMRMEGTSNSLVTQNAFTNNGEWGVRRQDWANDDFDGGTAGVQDPPGDNDLSGNVNGPLRED